MGIAGDVKNLAEDIVASYDARVKVIGTIVKDTRNTLKGFHAEHKEMSAKQAKDLADLVDDLTKNAAAPKSSLKKKTGDIETYVKNKLKEFSDAHAEMSGELKKELAKYVADIVKETKELLGAFHDEREKMAAHWQALTATMANKRGVEPVEVEAGAEVKTFEEAVGKPQKRKPGKEPANKC